ncbi:TWiK family of potassium channels protein 18-like [Euwallacea fornicatus]|uniref:TWiK family of potassium channels protein 18-like n=1 Tax=Euwallacea fornicatus TaxID=995702 RepID=UPI00338FFD49
MGTSSAMDTPLPSEGGSRRVAFANNSSLAGKSLDTTSVKSSVPSQKRYGRKASVFIIEHLSDMKHAGLGIGEKFNLWIYSKISLLKKKWFTHCFLIIVMILYTVGGAVIFLTVEGQNETKLIERDIELQVKELLDELRQKSLSVPDQFSEKEWSGEAARRLIKFEKKITIAFQQHPLVVSHFSSRVWTIWNAVVYCSTLYTTIGYGHLYPTTFTGRVLTIVYSIIGIPLFLIALTDFGKLFTRAIKFVWSYIRRFLYTRSCRKVRRTSRVQEIIKGAQVMYEYATFRKMSVWRDQPEDKSDPATPKSTVISEPQTPAPSAFEIDDEFNLPVSLALILLVAYMLIGAAVFMVWESWDFFPSFYFVFVSMSTIGFGDIVPEKPIYMILSIVYLCFGLALMTMCIQVVQDKLSDTFSQAQAKIGETIGIDVDENDEDEDNNDKESSARGEEEDENKEISSGETKQKENSDEVTMANGGIEGHMIQIEESPLVWATAKMIR